MGGRGGFSGVKVQSLDEYLGERGLRPSVSDYNLDKVRIPHAETLRQRKLREAAAAEAQRSYEDKRAAATKEYNALLESGRVRAPTRIEVLLKTARGNPDNLSVQAARRALEKRGINWRNGKKAK